MKIKTGHVFIIILFISIGLYANSLKNSFQYDDQVWSIVKIHGFGARLSASGRKLTASKWAVFRTRTAAYNYLAEELLNEETI